MPEQDDEVVRSKYGLASGKESPTRRGNEKFIGKERDFCLERSTLLQQFEKLTKFFLTRSESIVDNSSSNAEEFCTIIELCLDHGFKTESNVFSSKKTGCFWTILENYERKRASSVNQSAFEIVKKHLSLPNEKSKVRAWIKIGLTKKVLTSEIREAIRVIVNIEKCYHEWAFLRSESFSIFLSAIDSLNSRVDFNFVVKEHLLNLSKKPTKWKGLVDSEGLHLEVIAPYLQLDLPDNTTDVGDVQTADRTLIRQVGFLEDENVRLRKSLLVQLNENAVLEQRLSDLQSKKDQTDLYVKTLEEEVQRLNRVKYELEEEISARELQKQTLLAQLD